MPTKGGNLRANMQIFKIIGDGTPKNTSVILEDTGDVGSYNRANRSLTHFTENMAFFIVSIPVLGLIAPLPGFLLTCMVCAGRVLHQFGYASGGYGGHTVGFLLTTIALITMEGMLFVSGCRGMGVKGI